MSTEEDKFKKSKRLQKDENAVKKQTKIAKTHGVSLTKTHSFSKTHAMTCGDSNCVMCGNPRKFWGEKTIQEQRAEQDVESKSNDQEDIL
jgi:hypothetical protein